MLKIEVNLKKLDNSQSSDIGKSYTENMISLKKKQAIFRIENQIFGLPIKNLKLHIIVCKYYFQLSLPLDLEQLEFELTH